MKDREYFIHTFDKEDKDWAVYILDGYAGKLLCRGFESQRKALIYTLNYAQINPGHVTVYDKKNDYHFRVIDERNLISKEEIYE